MSPTTTPGTVFSTPSDREVAWTRSFAAPRERVFRAFTEPEHVQRWMLGPDGWTMPICEMDLRVGGGWRCVWRNGDGDEFELQGVFREIERPARIVYTESMMGSSEALQTIVLTEEGGITTMVSSLLYGSRAERDAAIATGMEKGASQSYDRLAEIVADLDYSAWKRLQYAATGADNVGLPERSNSARTAPVRQIRPMTKKARL
jgi:uncharacterized protein YndB with AHSA1/START domain